MGRLPFGERVLGDSPALSSSPGHTLTYEDGAFSDWKAAASAPTSAILWIALEIGPLRDKGTRPEPVGRQGSSVDFAGLFLQIGLNAKT